MRRSTLVFALSLAVVTTMALVPASVAISPGGWSHVGTGATPTSSALAGGSSVTALNTDNPGVLYVGGNFTSAGGNTNAQRIARWNGTSWSSLGAVGLSNGAVHAIAYHNGRVFAGGTFQNAGNNPAGDFLAVWNGTTWAPFCTHPTPGQSAFQGNVNALQIIGNTLFVGGSFQNGADIAAADYLLACDLTSGVASPTVSNDGDFAGPVHALTADSNGTLYAGGGFTNLDHIAAADWVATYDGAAWHAMGGTALDPAVDTFVRSLSASGTDVYVGTEAVNIDNIAQADHVARWNGSAWSAVGSDTAGTNGWFATASAYTIDALETYGSLVFAAGNFQNANGVATADNIAYFDGTLWRPIGSNGAGNGPLGYKANALGVTGGKVYTGGSFTSTGGDTLARFLAAYALRLPDNAISLSSGSGYVGNGIYSTTAVGEVRSTSIFRGGGDNFYVRIQNDGLFPTSFKVKGTGGASGITATYFRVSTGANITSGVKAGTYSTGTIAPRGTILLRVRVHATRTSAARTSFLIKSSSVTGTAPDAVRAKVTTHD